MESFPNQFGLDDWLPDFRVLFICYNAVRNNNFENVERDNDKDDKLVKTTGFTTRESL